MGGVVAGSTMIEVAALPKKWGALLINEGCNLECPRCYLGEKPGDAVMSQEVVEKLISYAKEHWDGTAIIGTEPLLDERSIKVVAAFASEITTHLITNGVNLEKFADQLKKVQRIDISLDGGPKTYCRSPNFESILAGAKKWKSMSSGKIYLLHVLSQENCRDKNIADMLFAQTLFGADKTIFSPYVQTIGGRSEMRTISIAEIANSLQHFSGRDWILILDPYHALLEQRSWAKIKEDVSNLPPENVLILDFDPGERIVRVDVNGYAHHPFLALHPGVKLLGEKLF